MNSRAMAAVIVAVLGTAALTWALWPAPPPASAVAARGAPADAVLDWSRVDVALQRAVDRVPGTHVTMRVERRGEVLYERTLGDGGSEVVPTGSVRKWTTAAALLTLVDSGQLDLDAPVGRYVKAWSGPDKQGITVRQTLSHTSGIVMRPPPGFCTGLGNLGACVAKSAQLSLLHEPGTRFHYSTMAFNVAARVAEQIVKKPWHRFWKQSIGEPVGMTRSGFVRAGPGLAEMPGMLVTNAEEFSRFLKMILDKGVVGDQRILSEAAVDEMEAGQTGGVPHAGPVPRREWWAPGDDFFGLGVWRNLLHADGSVRVVSAEGKHGFVALIDREHHVSAVMSMRYGSLPIPNKVRVDPVDVIYAVCDVLADAVGPNPDPNPRCLPPAYSARQVASPTF